MSRASSKANSILVVLLGAILLAGVVLHLVGGGGAQSPSSVYSGGDRGRSIAFELLHELGFEARAWTDSPGRLPRGANLLIAQRVPETPAHYAAAQDTVDLGASGLRDPAHYARFVEEGGTLLLTVGDEVSAFLKEEFGWSVPEELAYARDAESEASPLTRLGDVRLETDWNSDQRLVQLEGFDVLLSDAEGAPLASRRSAGAGRLVLLADDGWLDNESLPRAGCALLVVRLVEELAANRTVLFDEYVLGGWTPESPLDLAFGPSVFPFSLHLVLLLLAGVWIQAWVRAFPRDPPSIGAVSAHMRARGCAGLLTTAGRWTLLGSMLRRGVLRRLAARSGLRQESPGRVPAHSTGSGAEPREAWVRAALAPLLGGTERMALDQAVRLFTDPLGNSREELEALGRALGQLERATRERPTDSTD